VPNRTGSSTAYRYGFQGQEKDDELKGEGNSLNYTFRMHDPRVGRFFAVDPLIPKYPMLTPYQFSSNNPIGMIEVEGLEGSDIDLWMDDKRDEFLKTATAEEVAKYVARDKKYICIIGGVFVDLVLTKGQVTKYLFKQYATQTTINAGVSFLIDGKVSWSVFEDSFNEFDVADAGIDKMGDYVLDKYKIGKLNKLVVEGLKIYSSAYFDITYEDGVKVMKWSKDSDKIIGDILTNSFLSVIDETIGDKNDIPIGKLNKETVKKLTDYIKDVFSQTLIEKLEKGTNIKSKSDKINDIIKTKNDAINKPKKVIIDIKE
jgi:RHS repeat-associated protein